MPALIPGTSSRPADVYLPNWRRGQPAALDVTVISTLQQLTLEGAASTHAVSRSFGGEGEEDDSPFRDLSVSGGDLFTLGGGIFGGLGWGGC